jgi:hypothetical protein
MVCIFVVDVVSYNFLRPPSLPARRIFENALPELFSAQDE